MDRAITHIELLEEFLMKFRRVRAKDYPRLIELIDQLGYQIDEGALHLNVKFYGSTALLLEDKPKILGCLAYHILPVFHSSEKHMRIISLVVDERHRGLGLGKIIIEKVEEIARKKGCSLIELTSASHRTNSHEFYLKQGYKSDGEKLYFRKKVSVS